MPPVLGPELWSMVFVRLAPDYTDFGRQPRDSRACSDPERCILAIRQAQLDLLNCMKTSRAFYDLASRVLYRRPYVTFLGEFLRDSRVSEATPLLLPTKRDLLGRVFVLHIDDPLSPAHDTSCSIDAFLARGRRPSDDESLPDALVHTWNRTLDSLREALRLLPSAGGHLQHLTGVVIGSTGSRSWLSKALHLIYSFTRESAHVSALSSRVPWYDTSALDTPGFDWYTELPAALYLATSGSWCELTSQCSFSITRLCHSSQDELDALLSGHRHTVFTRHQVCLDDGIDRLLAPVIPDAVNRLFLDCPRDDMCCSDLSLLGVDTLEALHFDTDPERAQAILGTSRGALREDVIASTLASAGRAKVELYGWPVTPKPAEWQLYRLETDMAWERVDSLGASNNNGDPFDAFVTQVFGTTPLAEEICTLRDDREAELAPADEYYEAVGPVMDAWTARVEARIVDKLRDKEAKVDLAMAPSERRPLCTCGF